MMIVVMKLVMVMLAVVLRVKMILNCDGDDGWWCR